MHSHGKFRNQYGDWFVLVLSPSILSHVEQGNLSMYTNIVRVIVFYRLYSSFCHFKSPLVTFSFHSSLFKGFLFVSFWFCQILRGRGLSHCHRCHGCLSCILASSVSNSCRIRAFSLFKMLPSRFFPCHFLVFSIGDLNVASATQRLSCVHSTIFLILVSIIFFLRVGSLNFAVTILVISCFSMFFHSVEVYILAMSCLHFLGSVVCSIILATSSFLFSLALL